MAHIYMAKAAKSAKSTKPSAKTPAKAPAKRTPKGAQGALPSATPPAIPYFHLDAPADIARHLNATPVHLQGITGKGVRVVMIDSGFGHSHPYFRANGYTSSIVLAPGAADRSTDGNGHGTGESANIFAIAPGATFIGVKLDNEADPTSGASVLACSSGASLTVVVRACWIAASGRSSQYCARLVSSWPSTYCWRWRAASGCLSGDSRLGACGNPAIKLASARLSCETSLPK